jgi:hypothetical protein
LTTAQKLAAGIENSTELLLRYVAGFDDRTAVAQPPNLPNHVIWCLGHLALTMHRGAERLRGQTLELDYDPEPFAFGSRPTGDATAYPKLDAMIDRYRAAHRALADAVRTTGDDGLQKQVQWGVAGNRISGFDLALRMLFHNGTHCGQIADLRRALGMPSVLQPAAPATRA